MFKSVGEFVIRGLTDEVPAASSGGAADPVSLEHVDLPVTLGAVRQGVGGHVADLHLVVVPLEVVKLHPGVTNTITVTSEYSKDHSQEIERQRLFIKSFDVQKKSE